MKTKTEIFLLLGAVGMYLISIVHMSRSRADLIGLAMIWSAVALNGAGAYLMWKRTRI